MYYLKSAYEASIGETAKSGHTVIKSIKVSDPDLVGETLEIKCQNLPQVCGNYYLLNL
jgi:hypothetical protein